MNFVFGRYFYMNDRLIIYVYRINLIIFIIIVSGITFNGHNVM